MPRRLFLSIGYRLSTPVDAITARHARALDGALAVGRLLEIDVGTELAARREERVITDRLSIFDWPIVAGARLVRRGPRFTVGGGLFGALHLLWASATGDDGMQQRSFTATGGAGAVLLARLRLTGALAGELRMYAEVPLPTTRYLVRGTGRPSSRRFKVSAATAARPASRLGHAHRRPHRASPAALGRAAHRAAGVGRGRR